jgi:sigma-B regulation protein RsbU (phosphoserine phosphatase)
MNNALDQITHTTVELESARAVQACFFPRSRSITNLNAAVHCLPAEQIGGDICDVFEADRGRTALVIGDVSGKGLAAGLLTGVVYGSVHSSSWTDSSFQHEEATERLNDFLRRRTSADRFVSLFWGYYEPEASTFRYINAGHLPMLLVRRGKNQNNTVERLEKGGPVLGVVEWGNYQQGEIRIEEDDLLVMFSDGIVEAMNGARELFGEQGLFDIIKTLPDASPAEIQRAILDAVRTHIGENGPESDDQTLIVARFQDVFAGISHADMDQVAV